MPTTIEIPYKPRNWSMKLHDAVTRWIIIVMHRRGGKTTAVLNHLQRDCLRIKKSQFAFIGPTYKQVKRIAWEIAKDISKPAHGVPNEQDLSIKYPNGSKLFLAGSDNIDSLRGIALWGGAQDEAAQQPPSLFSLIISKALADHLGYWIWLGTPQGKNHFHRTYKNALKNPEEWTVSYKTIDDSLKEETGQTIDNLRIALEDDRKLVAQGEMTQEEFDQEWYCSFEASIRGAYYAKQIAQARKDTRIRIVPHDPALPVHTVIDLGVGTAFSCGFYQRIGTEMHMIDYWAGTEKDGLPEFAKMLQSKPYVYGKHFAPHDIRATEIGTGKTRLETAKGLGINFEVIPSMSVDDGINAGRLLWARLYVNEQTCEDWLDSIAQYRQDFHEKLGMFLEKPLHDWTSHGADVHRYAAIVEKLMTNESEEIAMPDLPDTYETPGIGGTRYAAQPQMPQTSLAPSKNRMQFLKDRKRAERANGGGYETDTPYQTPGSR